MFVYTFYGENLYRIYDKKAYFLILFFKKV